MPLPGRAKQPRDHKLALALELARRGQGLSTSELAVALSCNPRTVRRYLNGERRPQRGTVVSWETACRAEPGSLTALYDRSAGTLPNRVAPHAGPADHHDPAPSRDPRAESLPRRSRWRRAAIEVAAGASLVVIGVVAFAVLGLRGKPGPAATLRMPGPSSVATHRFPAAFVGEVWVRITPDHAHTGEDHLVTVHWGPETRQVVLKRLGPAPRSLLFRKNGRDDTPLQAIVQPPATVTFGIRTAPDKNALDINNDWTKSG